MNEVVVDSRVYCLVVFTSKKGEEIVSTVPATWVDEERNECIWPKQSSTRLIETCCPPPKNHGWRSYPVTVVRSNIEGFNKARTVERNYINEKDNLSESSPLPEKRAKIPKTVYSPTLSTAGDDETESDNSPSKGYYLRDSQSPLSKTKKSSVLNLSFEEDLSVLPMSPTSSPDKSKTQPTPVIKYPTPPSLAHGVKSPCHQQNRALRKLFQNKHLETLDDGNRICDENPLSEKRSNSKKDAVHTVQRGKRSKPKQQSHALPQSLLNLYQRYSSNLENSTRKEDFNGGPDVSEKNESSNSEIPLPEGSSNDGTSSSNSTAKCRVPQADLNRSTPKQQSHVLPPSPLNLNQRCSSNLENSTRKEDFNGGPDVSEKNESSNPEIPLPEGSSNDGTSSSNSTAKCRVPQFKAYWDKLDDKEQLYFIGESLFLLTKRAGKAGTLTGDEVIRPTEITKMFPVNNIEQLDKVHEAMNNQKGFKKKVVVELLRKVVKDDLAETARGMARFLYTDEFACNYSLYGFKRKQNFSSLKLTQLLFTALDGAFNDKGTQLIKYTDDQINKSIMAWLNYSKQRIERKADAKKKQQEKNRVKQTAVRLELSDSEDELELPNSNAV